MKTIQEIIKLSSDYLTKHNCPSPRTEAEWLIGHALDMQRMDLYMNFDKPLTEDQLAEIRALLKRRAAHEPVQYICGSTEFYGLDIEVGPGVLIPRPETERLVDIAAKKCPQAKTVLDLCTGTAIIPIALATELPKGASFDLVDLSTEALKYARNNCETYKESAEFNIYQGDLFTPLKSDKTYDLITSNPPYVTYGEYADLDHEVKQHEPQLALTADDEGLAILREIAAGSVNRLNSGGWLICEIGAGQGKAITEIFQQYFVEVELLQDYSKRDRIICGKKE